MIRYVLQHKRTASSKWIDGNVYRNRGDAEKRAQDNIKLQAQHRYHKYRVVERQDKTVWLEGKS